MKAINEKFLDEEFKQLEKAKKRAKAKNWHDFIMVLTNAKEDRYCEACRKEMKNERT